MRREVEASEHVVISPEEIFGIVSFLHATLEIHHHLRGALIVAERGGTVIMIVPLPADSLRPEADLRRQIYVTTTAMCQIEI